MIGKTNTGGSGGPGAIKKPTIIVNYPEGSTCTCSNGIKSFKALDTSGLAAFALPSLGTWTVTATANDGSAATASETVTVAAGSWVEVELLYSLRLFWDGDECEAVTGGWQGIGRVATTANNNAKAPTVSKLTSSVKIVWPGHAGASYQTKNYVDLSKYSVLYFQVDKYVQGSGVFLCVTPDASGNTSTTSQLRFQLTPSSTVKEYTCDISGISGGYICFAGYQNPEVYPNGQYIELSRVEAQT